MFQLGLDQSTTGPPPMDDIPFTQISFFERNPHLKVVDISSSSISTFFLMDDFSLYGCGCNQFGQLSLGDISFVKEITKIPLTCQLDRKISYISCGTKHSLIMTTCGDVYVCGASDDGQLSIQPGECVSKFTKIMENISIAKAIGKRTMVLTKQNKFFVCGENNYGQLGLGDSRNRLLLVEHPFFSNLLQNSNEFIVDIDGGISHTIIMTNKKRLFYFGNTFDSVIYISKPHELLISLPKLIKCTNYATFVTTERNKIFSCGLNDQFQIPIDKKYLSKNIITFDSWIQLLGLEQVLSRDEMVLDISGGSNHSCFHTNHGRIFICGKRYENGEFIKEPILIENPFHLLSNLEDYEIKYFMGRSSFFVLKTLNSKLVQFKKQLLHCKNHDLIVNFQ